MQTLDLSYNDLSDISEPDVFLPPLNLTNLHLSNNRLSHVPLDKILPLPNLRVLDLVGNDVGVFDEKFMRIVRNGTVLRYAGNEEEEFEQLNLTNVFELHSRAIKSHRPMKKK